MRNNTKQTSNQSGSSSELDQVGGEVESLQRMVGKFDNKKGLSEQDLLELAYLQRQGADREPLVDRVYQKKGFFNYWYVKMPAQVLSVGSIRDNQRFLHDAVRAVTSSVCPMCGKGILMYNLRTEPVEGKVRWFCSAEKECTYKVWAPPSSNSLLMNGVNGALSDNYLELGRARWEALTEEEKEELIKSHLSTAVLYRNLAIMVLIILIVGLVTQMWWGIMLIVGLLLLTVGLSIKWCYRAWQIKTGNVFLPKSKFGEWIRSADQYYSVDWVDNPNNEGEKND